MNTRQQANNDSKGTRIFITILVVLAIVGIVSFIVDRNSKSSGENLTQGLPDSSIQDTEAVNLNGQAKCLDDAYGIYKTSWDSADSDKDGKVAYADGASTITTAYYDAQINCYRIWKTSDGSSYITDLQAKRQQEVDTYTAWLESLKSTYGGSTGGSVNCTSYSYGIDDRYTSTQCY